MTGLKMEARIAQMEARILKEQDERFNKMLEAITSIPRKVTSDSDSGDGKKISESTESLIKLMTEMKEKVDLLLGGENEANKLIDSIVPNVDKISRDLKSTEKHLLHKIDRIESEIKKLREDKKVEDLLKDVNHSAKRTREETNDKFRDIKSKMEEIMKTAASPGKKCRSRSLSSDHGKRDRHHSNGSSRSRSRRRGRGSREDSISSLSRSKTELEVVSKLDSLITDVADFRKETGPRKQIEDQMLTNIIKVASLLEQQAAEPSIKIPGGPSRWEDDDRSPSPPSKRLSRSPLKLPKLSKDQKKKKKKGRSASSSSSSSSSEERSAGRELEMKPLDVMVGTLATMEEKIKEMNKNSKKNNQKLEEYCKSTQERVGEMVLGVQVIAENLDNINDVATKMNNLDKFSVKLDKLDKLEMLSKLDKLDRVDRISEKIEEMNLPSHSGPQRGEELGWEETRRPETEELERKIDSRFCEFTGLIEDFTDKLSHKMDSISSERESGEDVREIRRILRRLEEGPALWRGSSSATPPHSAPSQSLSEYKASQLERQMCDISPKLDDLYIRVLPILEDIKKTQRREAERENMTIKEVRESQEKLEKVLFMVEDLKEDLSSERVPGSLDRRINSAIEMEGVVQKLTQMENTIAMRQKDCLNALVELRTYTAKQSSVDQILKQKEDLPLGSGEGADIGRIERRLNTQLDFMKKQEKSIERLIKNSESDAKLLSQSNTSLQGMKSAVTANGREVLSALTALGDDLRSVDDHSSEVKTEVTNLAKILNEIGGRLKNSDSRTYNGDESIAKLQAGIDKLSSNLRALEKSGKIGSSGSHSKETTNLPAEDKCEETISDSKLEVIKGLMSKQEKDILSAIKEVTAAVTKSERGMGGAMNTLAKLLKTCVDLQKNGELEKNLKECIETSSNDIQYNVEKCQEKLEDLVQNYASGDNHGNESSVKIDSIVTKLEKLNKNVVRIKYLVEDGSDDEDQSKKKKSKMSDESLTSSADIREIEKLLSDVSERLDLKSLETRFELLDSKLEEMSRGTSDKKIEDLIFKVSEIEESISRRIEDDLSANVEKIEEIHENVLGIKNVTQEVGNRMITNRVFNNSLEELRRQLSDVQSSIGSFPDDISSQVTTMEENICTNVENTVKDVFKQHWEELMNEIDQILGKLTHIKRFIKARSREGSVDGGEEETPNMESVVQKINDVAEKLSAVQSAMETGLMSSEESNGNKEQLSSVILLTEIRKRADVDSINKLKKEMFTAVHNVQRRLLEDQVIHLPSLSFLSRFFLFSIDFCPTSRSLRETLRNQLCLLWWSALTR